MSLSDELERAIRGSMYAEVYAEAVAEFKIWMAWREFRPEPGKTITIRRPERATGSTFDANLWDGEPY